MRLPQSMSIIQFGSINYIAVYMYIVLEVRLSACISISTFCKWISSAAARTQRANILFIVALAIFRALSSSRYNNNNNNTQIRKTKENGPIENGAMVDDVGLLVEIYIYSLVRHKNVLLCSLWSKYCTFLLLLIPLHRYIRSDICGAWAGHVHVRCQNSMTVSIELWTEKVSPLRTFARSLALCLVPLSH